MVQMVKNLPAMQEIQVESLGHEDPLEKGMATHSSILAWRHDLATNTLFNNKTAFFLNLGKKKICVVQLGNFVLCDRSSSPDCY